MPGGGGGGGGGGWEGEREIKQVEALVGLI